MSEKLDEWLASEAGATFRNALERGDLELAERVAPSAREAFRHASAGGSAWADLWLAEAEHALGDSQAALGPSMRVLGAWERGALALSDAGASRELLYRAQRRVRDAAATVLESTLGAVSARHGADAIARARRAFDEYVGRTAPAARHPLQNPTFLFVPDLPIAPWLERTELPFLAGLEAQTDAIREEALGVIAEDAELAPYVDMPDSAPGTAIFAELNRSPRWSAYHFYRHGTRIDAHCRRCPRTAAALEALPLMRVEGHSPEAMFSVLRPRTHIPPHTGVMNGRLTVHLPLIVPPQCGKLAVAHEARRWRPGRCLIFDDSYVHEALNESNETRVVLIFDIWNPHLTMPEREALAAGIAAIGALRQEHEADAL